MRSSAKGTILSEELDILKLVIKHLNQKNIHYMITGSIAANFYAVPRMTRDIDIVIELPLEKIDQLYDIFKEEFYVDKEMISAAVRERGSFNIIHNQALVKVDFIVRKESEYRKLEFDRRRSVIVEGERLFIVAPEDLVISKLWWAKDSRSEVQLGDIRHILEEVKDIDREYMKKWIDELGLSDIYRELI